MAKILLVEDDNNLREIYEARLQAEGYEIISAQDGEQALVVAKAEKPDLVISDVMMPKISGFEMLDILRNTDGLKAVKVIMLTALGQSEDQSRADKLGADRYLVKSQVTLEDIVKASQQLLIEAGAPGMPEPEPEAPVAVPAATPIAEPTPAAPIAVAAPPAPAVAPAPAPPGPDPVAMPVTPPPADPVVLEPVPEPTPVPADPQPVIDPVVAATPAPAEPEPVVTPVPAVVEPEAVPTPEPMVTTAPAPAPAVPPVPAVDMQTSAQEEATVEQQIENFVKDQPAAEQTVAEHDDTVMDNAVDDLVESAEGTVVTPTESAAAIPVEVKIPIDEEQSSNIADSAPVAHKKIIKPLEKTGDPVKTLDQLLAEEAAKEAVGGQPTGAIIMPHQAALPDADTAPNEDAPSGELPKKPGEFDPNSISL